MALLYRSYRPQFFRELVGQTHISEVLKLGLVNQLISHAYLFAGPRGTGKTTVARIFAKAVNCLELKDGEPCGRCQICEEISSERSLDIIEIDAASNRGIDEIRSLREKLSYQPMRAKYKVYIIDEAHMLTEPAFNALLKSLEEPPAHVIFILATTEYHKLPETIISRCQRLHFNRAAVKELISQLSKVAERERIEASSEALELIAQRAEGSFRDSLTLLESFRAMGSKIDQEIVRKTLALPRRETLEQLIDLLISGKTDELLNLMRSILKEGISLEIVVKSAAEIIKDEILERDAKDKLNEKISLLEQFMLVQNQAKNSFDPSALIVSRLMDYSIKKFSEQVKLTENPAIFVKDLRPKEGKSDKNLAKNVDSVTETESVPFDGQEGFYSQFLSVIKNTNHAIYAVLRSARFEGIEENKMLLTVRYKFYSDRLKEPRNLKLIESTATHLLNRPIQLVCQVRSDLEIFTVGESDLFQSAVEVFELEGDQP